MKYMVGTEVYILYVFKSITKKMNSFQHQIYMILLIKLYNVIPYLKQWQTVWQLFQVCFVEGGKNRGWYVLTII